MKKANGKQLTPFSWRNKRKKKKKSRVRIDLTQNQELEFRKEDPVIAITALLMQLARDAADVVPSATGKGKLIKYKKYNVGRARRDPSPENDKTYERGAPVRSEKEDVFQTPTLDTIESDKVGYTILFDLN